jgi:hypothetical protein
LRGTELDVLGPVLSGPVLSGPVLDVLGAVLSGAVSGPVLDVLGAVSPGALVDELESATDDVLAGVAATLDGVLVGSDELDSVEEGTDEVGGAESNWAAAKPPSPRAKPIAPAATSAAWRGSRLRGDSGSGLAMCSSGGRSATRHRWVW